MVPCERVVGCARAGGSPPRLRLTPADLERPSTNRCTGAFRWRDSASLGAQMAPEREILVYSVADLDRRLKRAVEGATADVWVEGEVTGAKQAPSGHVYFC